ncbi:S8 family serine peptidase [Spirosoma sordidisoli]|uniref:Peptidase S8 n=1 Tax=Spirosoma sordidisoli TaxID=2502893 RepID=A0A4Q2UKG9_9BACT|nr:S8 family serine peptidase [Spirosoma sordidisoli]RYC67299.1 peptidase S8 [Spirosoma sordidisoli]
MNSGLAQPLPQYNARQQAQLQSLKQLVQAARTDNYNRAVQLANRLGRPLVQTSRRGEVIVLDGLDDTGNLRYVGTTSATRAGNSTRTSSLYTGGSLGLNLSGSSESVRNRLGMWEVRGLPRTTHLEMGGRINQIDVGQTTSPDEILHSTHVAGIMIAQGRNPLARGMAYGANLQSYNQSNDAAEMTGAAANLLVSNHSYGTITGWRFNDSRTTTTKWEWWGDTAVSQTDDYKFGFYESSVRTWDQIMANAPYYLIVKSAGNNHGSNGPGAGQPYYLGNSNTISTVARASQNGYDNIPTQGTAKNILTVGAVSNLSAGYNQPGDVQIADFSSWGPTDDGRIKPDLVGVGVSVLSTSSASDSAYTTLSGTSMSTPNVSGTLLLLQELYAQRNNGQFMRASTLKGLAIHTADEAGPAPGPDYRHGWGLLNAERAGRAILNTDRNYLVSEQTLTQSQSYTLAVVASGRGPLMATIAWTDPAGTTTSPVTLNDRTPKLVNDLDIRISDGPTSTLPWILDPANPAASATRGDNSRDNVEQVLLASPEPGKSYTITVSHKRSLSGTRQDYALLVSGIGGQAYCASGPSSSANSKISRVQLGTIDQAGGNDCTTYSDFSQTTTSVQAGQQLPLTVSLGTCGEARTVTLKAFADWNQNGTFTDPGETIAQSGTLTNTGVFSTTVGIPATAQNGQFIRLRIVAVETADAATISACGTYGNGETQDYGLRVIQTVNDIGTVALLSPQSGFCGQTNRETLVTVRIRNFGSATQRDIPVSVTITDTTTNTPVATLTSTLPLLSAFRQAQLTLTLPATTVLTPGRPYRFTVSTGLDTDLNPANNILSETRVVATQPTTGLFAVVRCGSDTAIALRNTGGGTAFWYDAPTGGNLLAAGNRADVKALPASGQFYASLNEFSGSIGPVEKRSFGGGTYGTGFQPAPLVTTAVPLLIESARLYIGSAGQLTFTVRRYDDTPVSSVTLDVVPTRGQSVTTLTGGTYPDDAADRGAVYPLNLRLPEAGQYKITIDYADGASIFRSNLSVSGFPFQLRTQTGQPVVTIRGSLFNNGTTTDTLTAAWYYFYDLKVRSLDCPAPARVAVTPTAGTTTAAAITTSGSTSLCEGSSVTLQANTGSGLAYQWLRDGQALGGATSSTLAASTTGSYAVRVTGTCLPVLSAAVPVTVRPAEIPTIATSGLTLTTNAVSNIQWLLDGIPIAGATAPTYTAVRAGRYSIRGGVNGCGEGISAEVVLTILAEEPTLDDLSIQAYPNPVTRQLTVSVSAEGLTTPRLRLTDGRGLTVRSAPLQRDGNRFRSILEMGDLPGGTFFVVVDNGPDQRVRVKRISKQ